jgi:hypothetical protein
VTPKPPPDEQRRQEALEELERLRQGGDTLGSSAMSQAARRAFDHFSARDAADSGDRIELWGRRIGRSLSLIVAIGLAIYLYLTYVR